MATTAYFSTFEQLAPQTCLVDTTAPTFAGIASATPGTDGSIQAAWLAGSDVTTPIEYLIYLALGVVNAAALFQASNLVSIAPAGALSKKVFTLGDQTTYFVNGQQYTMGVRARDGVGNINTNTVLLTPTATGSGNLPAVFQTVVADLQDLELSLSAAASAIAGGAGTQLSVQTIDTVFVSNETFDTVMSIESDGVI
jgi:hypothetical protein